MTIDKSDISAWPPQYTIRRSLKARRTFLQISSARGLEIVVPDKQKRVNILKILNQKRHWIEKIFSQKPQYLASSSANLLRPNSIECKALEEVWRIVYQPSQLTPKIKLTAEGPERILVLTGNTEDISNCYQTLTKWLVKKAHLHLIPWLESLSNLTKLEFNRVIIRGQSTLWGSCNAKKTISLNYKLLFLPKSLVEHVLLHELCHTQYLDHSSNFWQLFKSFEPNCMENKKVLRTAECHFPAWVNVV